MSLASAFIVGVLVGLLIGAAAVVARAAYVARGTARTRDAVACPPAPSIEAKPEYLVVHGELLGSPISLVISTESARALGRAVITAARDRNGLN